MIRIGLSLLFLLALTACGPSRETPAPAAEAPTRPPVPTYTPTPLSSLELPAADLPTTTVEEAAPLPVIELPTATPESAKDAAAAAEIAPESRPAEPAAATSGEPVLTVTQDAVNVRVGPGTGYVVTGLVVRGATLPITGRNEAGDWWQVCCIDGRAGWLYDPLVTTANTAVVAVVADFPAAPIAAEPVPVVAQPAVEAPAEALEETAPVEEAPAAGAEVISPPQDNGGTIGNFDPNAHYQIVHYRVLGFDDNNGGIFSKGGQQLIFLTVLDQNGQGVDGVIVKDAVGNKLNVITGSKGPGKAEIKMDWDPYKLYVASDASGAVTSQISNQMNNPYPHLPDVIGMLGPLDNEYSVCPTPEVRCTPPFFSVHFSYEVTFQRVR